MVSESRPSPAPQEDLRHDSATAWQSLSEDGFPNPLLDLIAEQFRLLGEPLRLKLLAVLGQSERSVGELVALTGAGQPNVSKHLTALAQGGIVQRRKVGTSILYRVADPAIFTLCNVVCAGVQSRLQSQVSLLAHPTSTNVSVLHEPGVS